MVDGQKRFCICREYFVSQVWRFFEEEDLFLFEICLIGKLYRWDIMVNLWQQQNTSLPRKDDSVFELTERKCFICSFLRFRLSGWPSDRVTIAGASCQPSRGEYHLWDKTGTKQDYRWETVHREDTSLSEFVGQKDWHHQFDNDTLETKNSLYQSRFISS